MDRLYIFLIRNDIWIYIICGLGLFWYISELIRARQQLRRAVFGLEKETGNRIQGNSLLLILLLGSIVAGVVYVNVQILPTLPAELLVPPTLTPDIFNVPLKSPTPLTDIVLESNVTPTSPLAPTVTLAGTDDVANNQQATGPQPPGTDDGTPGTVEPQTEDGDDEGGATEAPAPPGGGCSPLVNISQPSNGSSVFGSVAFLGSASDPDFAFYKLEINGPQTENQWASVVGQVISNEVVNGLLGSANFNGWLNGRYTVRLTVVDITSNEVASCSVQVTVTS